VPPRLEYLEGIARGGFLGRDLAGGDCVVQPWGSEDARRGPAPRGAANDRAAYRGVTSAITVLGLLIVAISMVALINTITMVVLERTREIGILRCIGAHARDVRRIFATEGLTVALAGWLIGIPLGFGLAHGVVTLAENVFNEHVLFTFPAINIPIALIGTLILALLVMQIPLRRAVRFKPGEALRYA